MNPSERWATAYLPRSPRTYTRSSDSGFGSFASPVQSTTPEQSAFLARFRGAPSNIPDAQNLWPRAEDRCAHWYAARYARRRPANPIQSFEFQSVETPALSCSRESLDAPPRRKSRKAEQMRHPSSPKPRPARPSLSRRRFQSGWGPFPRQVRIRPAPERRGCSPALAPDPEFRRSYSSSALAESSPCVDPSKGALPE